MVAGKVKQAMGLQKSSSPASTPKPETTTPKHFPSPSSTTTTKTPSSNHQKPVFSRSFGVYFPRSSAQVQPRPPDVTELLRIVEELKDRESQLKTKLVEQKLLKESAAIVPFLENEINSKNVEIECSVKRIESLEADNERLRGEMESLMVRIEEQRRESGKKMKEMEEEILELKRCLLEKNRTTESKMLISAGESDECSSSQRFLGLMDASAKSNLLRNLKRVRSMDIGLNQENHKVEVTDLKKEEVPEIPEISEIPIVKCKGPRVPKPPPKLSTPSATPSSSSSSSCSSSSSSSSSTSSTSESTEIPMNNKASSSSAGISDLTTTLPPIPPPPPPPFSRAKTVPVPPPPPPLPAAKGAKSTVAKVKRVPEVVEFYHSLMRRDSRKESGVGVSDVQSAANTRDMIGEIENRSAHLIAIKTDVETQGDFIRFLIKEVENAAFTNIEDVVAFVKWLDDELSYLVDERAVLKHFEWPETKADALREAAFGYCDLKKLESEASTFCEDIRQSNGGPILKKMQALLEKLEHGVYNLSRMRESATKKYKGFCIPTEWMSETGFVSQIKLVSVKLAMKYMKRVSAELEAVGSAPEVEELMLQGVRFAFRVHQFAGGFDMETMRAFQELKNKARSCHVQIQNHQQQKLICRSTPC